MAVLFDHRAIAWNAADGGGTNYVVNSLSFQPTAQFFKTNGQANATDAATASTSARICFGLAASTTDRACMGLLNVDAATAADTQEIFRVDAIAASVSSAGAMDGLLDLSARASNGYTLTVDDTIPANIMVFVDSWGGDVLQAEIVHFAEAGGTGLVDYTLAGAFRGDAAIFVGCQLTNASAANTAAVQDSGLMVGWATGPANQWVMAINSDEGSANADVDEYARGDECLAMMTVAGGNPNARASFSQWNTNGFQLNWIARAVANRRYMAMVMQGGAWQAGTYTVNCQATNNTATVSGLMFSPVGALSASHGAAQSTAGTSTTSATISYGCWSSTSSRRSMGYSEVDAAGNMDVQLAIDYDSINAFMGGGAVFIAMDVIAVNSDGFQVNVDLGNGAASNAVLMGYLAFGTVAWQPAIKRVGGVEFAGVNAPRSQAGGLW